MTSNNGPTAGQTTTQATLQKGEPSNGALWGWVSPTADVVTLVGFLLTVWVLIQTHRLRGDLASRARVPDIRKSLEQEGRELVRFLGAWPNTSRDVMISFSKTRGILGNLKKKLKGENRALADKIMRSLDRRSGILTRKKSDLDLDEAWQNYGDLQKLIAALEQHEKDYVWK